MNPTERVARGVVAGVAAFFAGCLAVAIQACRHDDTGPRQVSVHFIGPVKLYEPREGRSTEPEWAEVSSTGRSPLPRYLTGQKLGLLFDPLPKQGRQCDPFAAGTLELALESPGGNTDVSVTIPLEPPYLEQAGSSYRLFPVPQAIPARPEDAFVSMRLPEEPGLWHLCLVWRCGRTERGARRDRFPFVVGRRADESACDPSIWMRLDTVDDRPPRDQLEVFRAILDEPLCLVDRLWVTKYYVQTLRSAGDYPHAESMALTWANLAQRAGFPSEAVLALNAAHEAARDRGNLLQALSYLDRSLALARSLDYQVRYPEEYFSRAWTLNKLGRLLPALEMAVEAEDQARRVGKRYFRLEAVRLKLSLLQALGHHRLVQRYLEEVLAELREDESATLYNNMGWLILRGVEAGVPLDNDRREALDLAQALFEKSLRGGKQSDPYRAGTVANLAYVALLEGDLEAARRLLSRAEQLPAPSDPELHLFLARVNAELALAGGDSLDALQRFGALEREAEEHGLVKYAAEAAHGQGEALRARGALEDAIQAFDRALRWVEANDAIPSPLHEATLLADRAAWEARAILTRLDLHRDLEALDQVERCAWARWRSQGRAARRDRLTARETAELRKLEDTRQALDQEIVALRRVPSPGSSRVLRAKEERREATWARIETILGDAQRDVPPFLEISRLREVLPDNGVLVRPAIFPGELVVWTVSREAVSVRRVPIARAALETLAFEWIEACRRDAESSAGARLSRMLLEDLADASAVVVVADGVLRAIPWSALPVGDRPLVQQHDLLVVPSLFWTPPSPGKLEGTSLIVVDPNHDLAGAAGEGGRLQAILPSPHLLARSGATKEAVLTAMTDASLFHFAGHAVIDEERPFLSFLGLARGERLTKMDIRGLRLPGPLVFLNACGAGQVSREGGGALGIADGFVASGARAVVATLWDVSDLESAKVSPLFYRHLEADDAPPFVALGRVQRDLIAGRGGESCARRSVWAGYLALGAP